MASVKLTTFLISMVLIGLIVTVLGFFVAEMNTQYSLSVNDSNFSTRYSKLDDLNQLAEDTSSQSVDLTTESNALDLVGTFFKNGYQALIAAKDSMALFGEISNDATEDINFGASGAYFKTAITTIVILLIVIGVFISAIVKRDL